MTQTNPDPDLENPEFDSSERPHASEIKPPGPFRRFGYNLFSRETGTGRFLRGLGRFLLTIFVLVGAGVLITYLLLYRPLEQQLNEARQTISQSSQDLDSAQKDRDLALQQQQDADNRAEDAQNRLSTALTRVQLLRVLTSLKNAQLAIQEKDKTAASNAINAADTSFKQAVSRLKTTNPNEAAIIQDRFDLVRKQMDVDPVRALPDIELLTTDLIRLDNILK